VVKSLIVESVTSKDGKLSLADIETGLPATAVRVHLIIDRSSAPEMSPEELSRWSKFVDRTEGRIDDPTFLRQPHGIYEPPPNFDDE
jgi:hypothetical protein